VFFFFNDTATTEIYTLSLHDALPISPLPGNASAMILAMQDQAPVAGGNTPTECGLRGMINECLRFMAQSPTGEQCVAVLVTDGSPTQCDQLQSHLIQIVADGKTQGVATWVLSLPGSSPTFLDQLANAGGSGTSVEVNAGSQAFDDALRYIRRHAGSQCPTACSVASQKMCGGSCMGIGPANGCSKTTCNACAAPVPTNGVAACNGGQCDFECLSGFVRTENSCASPPTGVLCNGQLCTNSCSTGSQCCNTVMNQCGCLQGAFCF